jgi:gamma-glutamylputrescine oxidase
MTESAAAPASLWWEIAPSPAPAFSGELDSDILIIGGGITGLTLAYTLAEQDASVGLFDAGPLAGGASSRNAGFLTVAPAEPYAEQVAMWGRLPARAALEIGRKSHQRVRHLVETLGIDCDYRASGSLRLTRTEEETEDIRASLPLLQADGFPMSEVAPSDVVPAAAASRFHAGFLTPEDGEIHPVRFLNGVARAAAQRGARLYADSPVRAAEWRSGLWEVRLDSGRARARTLVIATNAFASLLCPELEPIIRPRRGQMLATEPLDEIIIPRPTSAHWGYQYWRQTADRRLVIGGWRDLDLDGEVGFDERPTAAIQAGIETGLRQLVTEGVRIERRWAGIMGFARDGRPLVGWLDADHHLAICAGYTGHGMGMAAGCTEEIANLLSWKRAPAISAFDPQRFPELKGARGRFSALGAAGSGGVASAAPEPHRG